MSLQLLVVYGISHFFLAAFMLVFTKRRYSMWITAAVLAVTYILVFMLEFLRYRLSGMGYTWRFTMVIASLVSISGELIVSQYRDGRAVFTAFLGGSYIMCGDMMAKILLSVNAVTAVVFAAEIVCHVLLLFLLIRFLLPSYRKLQQIYRAEWRQITIVLVMFYCGVYLLFDCLKRPDVTVLHYMMPLAYLFTIYLLIILMFQMLGRLKQKELEVLDQNVLGVCMEALKMEVDQMRRAERRIAEYNHDSRHFVRMLRGMMAEQDYEGVERTLAEMMDMPDMAQINRYCRNIPINGVISHYVRLAESQQIQMTVELELLPDDLGGNDWGIAMVLGNILENAVCASKSLEMPDRRRLHVVGRQDGKETLLEIRNVFSEEDRYLRGANPPVMGDREGRGLGIRSLAGLVGQWKGTLEYGVEDEWFYVRIRI